MIIKTVNRVCVKRCQIYIYWVKKELFGCFRIEKIRDNANETGLKEGRVIKILTTENVTKTMKQV